MFNFITEQLNGLKTIQELEIPEIIKARQEDILNWVQGAYARSALSEDPIKLAKNNPARLTARFKNKPGYILFDDKLYLIRFKAGDPRVTPILFNTALTAQELTAIKAKFPLEPEALITCSDAEQLQFLAALEPAEDLIEKDARHQTTLKQVLNASVRTSLSVDPCTLMKENPDRLKTHLKAQSGCILFEDKLYLVQFIADEPNVTQLTFKTSLSTEKLTALKASFPLESQALALSSATEQVELAAAVEPFEPFPTSFSFNTALLGPYFKDTQDPFIEFSAIGLIKAPNTTKNDQDLLEFVTTLREANISDADLPFIISMGNRYYLHGNTDGTHWRLTELSNATSNIRNLLFTSDLFRLEYHAQHSSLYQEIIAKEAHTHFSTQPQQVSQINKLMSSLSRFKLVFQDIQNISLQQSYSGIVSYITGKTYDNAYQGLAFLANLDIDFAQRFKDEVLEFLAILERFNLYSNTEEPQISSQAPNPVDPSTYQPSYSFQTGYSAGFATRYIYDPDGQLDADIVSQFSADLPKHLDVITTMLNSNTDSVTQHAPNIDAAQLKTLQKEATKLLSTLKNTQKNAKRSSLNPLYQIYHIINYVFLIRHSIVLLTTTLKQIGHLSDAYQELLRTYLEILHDQLIPELFRVAYKIEIEFVLDPGTLSQPLRQKITAFYTFLKARISGLANFSFRGEELLVLENSRFITKCETHIQNMHQECDASLLKISWARTAAKEFWNNLNTNLTELHQHYAWFSPYLQKANPQAHANITTMLNGSMTYDFDVVLEVRHQLFAYLTKLEHTEKLRIQQCQAVLDTMHHYAQVQLFPHNERVGCDIALIIIKDTPIHSLTLSTKCPILIQYEKKSETKYLLYGNGDGTKWDYTPIDAQFIHPDILRHFAKIRQEEGVNSAPKPLSYHAKYRSFYKQMIIKKAHTHYRSQFSSLESKLFIQHETMTQSAFKQMDKIQAWWHNASRIPAQAETPITPAPSTPVTIVTLHQFQDQCADLQELSGEQALQAYFWYQHKIAAYTEACHNLALFKHLIHQYYHAPRETAAVTSPIKKQCRDLYQRLQPYLIGMYNFPNFDHKIVRILSDQNTCPEHALTESEHQHFNDFSLDAAQPLVAGWTLRATAFLERAKTAYAQDYNQNALRRRSIKIDPRANFLLKNTLASKKIKEFNAALQKWIPIFNQHIQRKLQPTLGGVPYPSIQSLQGQLSQPAFLLIWMRLINTGYYLEQIALTLETITTERTPDIKNATINSIKAMAEQHVQPLINMGLQLREDPILAAVYKDILKRYKQGIQYISTFLLPYTTSANEAYPRNEGVTYPGLWYTLNTLYVIPEHLLALTEQRDKQLGRDIRLIHDRHNAIQTPAEKNLTLIWHNDAYYMYCNGNGGQWQLRMLPSALVTPLNMDFTQESLDFDSRYQPLYDYLLRENYHTVKYNKQFGRDIRLVHDQHDTVQTPAEKDLTLIWHNDAYHMYCNGDGDQWQLRALPPALVASLNIDFTQKSLDYDSHYQPLYDYLLAENYHTANLDALQISAKRATRNIEEIIRNSDHYFKLFFCNSYMIYQLNQELQKQLEHFTRTSQQVVMSHLDILLTDCIAPVMLEADLWEHRLGLTGKITEPLQEIIDDCYQGLVFPLKLSFEEKERLVNNDIVLTRRIDAEEKRHHAAAEVDQKRVETQTKVTQFTNLLSEFQNTLLWSPVPISELNATYKVDIQPKLKIHQHSFIPSWIANIPLRLNADNLAAVKTLVSTYYEDLAAFSLLSTAEEEKFCKTIREFIEELAKPLSEDVMVQYREKIAPALKKHKDSFIPAWIKKIASDLDSSTLKAVLEQASTYGAYLDGLRATQQLSLDNSAEKLAYLKQRQTQHQTLRRKQYRESFAKHHLHIQISRLPYQAMGFAHSVIHREYYRKLQQYLTHNAPELLNNIDQEAAVDTCLNEQIQAKSKQFNAMYHSHYQRFDHIQTALNEFKTFLLRDRSLPLRLRQEKMACLKKIEDIIQKPEPHEPAELELHLNQRLQKIIREINQSEQILLKHAPQFTRILDWLLDCLEQLFIAIGYPSKRQQHYTALVNAHTPLASQSKHSLSLFFSPSRTLIRTPGPTPAPMSIQSPGNG